MGVVRQSGSVLKLGCYDVGVIATDARIVVQLLPGNRVEVGTKPQEAAKAHHSLSHTPADLLDHKVVDGADVPSLSVVDLCSLDPVALDQGVARGSRF